MGDKQYTQGNLIINIFKYIFISKLALPPDISHPHPFWIIIPAVIRILVYVINIICHKLIIGYNLCI